VPPSKRAEAPMDDGLGRGDAHVGLCDTGRAHAGLLCVGSSSSVGICASLSGMRLRRTTRSTGLSSRQKELIPKSSDSGCQFQPSRAVTGQTHLSRRVKPVLVSQRMRTGPAGYGRRVIARSRTLGGEVSRVQARHYGFGVGGVLVHPARQVAVCLRSVGEKVHSGVALERLTKILV
jgi:hypothetical protein